jgi:hypothetical protein
MTAPTPSNTYPYNENYLFPVERDLWAHTLLSLSYVGSQAHHWLVIYSANPGNPALCLALTNPALPPQIADLRCVRRRYYLRDCCRKDREWPPRSART